MLEAHMNAVENALIQTSQIPANAGHTLHRGTPRENLISNFLTSHLSSNVEIGTGEIFDHQSKPREPRNQFDIVIYRKNYPKLDFGGVNGFFVESVVATIEVKSILDQKAIEQATNAAAKLKRLEPQYSRIAEFGWFPPKPLSFVIAYAGPANMTTVSDWVSNTRLSLGVPADDWSTENRLKTHGQALDGISVLGLGAHYICNTPLFPNEIDSRARSFCWEGERGSLMFFFLALQQACMNLENATLQTRPYLKGHSFDGTFYM